MSDYEYDETTGEAPIELYRFVRGTNVWTYTSGDMPRVLNDEMYQPAAITRTLLNNSDEASSDTIDIVVPRDLAVAAQFISGPPPEPVLLTIYRSHRNAPTTAGIMIAGEVSAAAFDSASVTLTCEGVAASLSRTIPRVVYQSACNNSLYDDVCQVLKATYRVADTVTAIDGLAITVTNASAKPNDPSGKGYYAGGIVEFGSANGFVESQAGNVLTLMYPVDGLVVGSSVSILPGCSKLDTICDSKFGNISHFQGFPYIPNINPFKQGVA